MCGVLCPALDAQVITLPPPTGLSDEVIVTVPPAQDVVIYHTGLLGLINKAQLERIELQITALAPPDTAALEGEDFKELLLVESTNHVYGDADDVVLNTIKKKDIVVDGGVTVIDDAKGDATPVGLFPLPVGELLRHYFVVARIAASATQTHAFRVGAAPGHITMSTPPALGQPVWASNDDRVVIGVLPTEPPVVPTLSASSVDFGLITFGQTGSASVELSNPGASPIDITGVAFSDPQFSTTATPFTLNPGQTIQIPLRFAATSLGTKTATLSIELEGDIGPVEATLQADATVALGKASMNFGQIPPGKTALLPVRIDNPSGAAVTITSIVSNNPRFVPAVTSCVIPAGGFHNVMISFTPTDGTRQDAQLAITHNPTVFVGVVANSAGQAASAGVDAVGNPLKTFAVPFGGEWLASLLICLYALRLRSRLW